MPQEQQTPPAPAEDKLLKPADVAQRMNVELRQAYAMLAPGGVLHHLRKDFGRKTVRVCPEALEKFIQQQGPAA